MQTCGQVDPCHPSDDTQADVCCCDRKRDLMVVFRSFAGPEVQQRGAISNSFKTEVETALHCEELRSTVAQAICAPMLRAFDKVQPIRQCGDVGVALSSSVLV